MKESIRLIIILFMIIISCKQKSGENNIKSGTDPFLQTMFSYVQGFKGSELPQEKYYNAGCEKMWKSPRDFKGAIEDFDKAIASNPTFIQAFQNRGYAKANIQDFMGAIADYNKELEIKDSNPIYHNDNNDDVYNNRGVAKYNLKDYSGAASDFNKAIELNSGESIHRLYKANSLYQLKDFMGVITECNYMIESFHFNNYDKNDAYYWRGLAKIQIGQKESGCLDLSKAGELGFKEAYEAIKKYCQ